MEIRDRRWAPSSATTWIPVQGQAGYFGTVRMGDEEAVVALRLKVQWNQVTEAEWFISRKSDPGTHG